MSEEKLETLLQKADEIAGKPVFGAIKATGIRRQIRRRLIRAAVPLGIAAAAIFATALLAINMQTERLEPQPQRITSAEEEVRQLQARTDATLRLVQEVLEKDKQQRRLAALEAELASIPDPTQQIEQQVDKTVFLLIYQADRLYKKLNQTESAVAAYKEIIQLFPNNRWAHVARERLAGIDKHRFETIGS